MKFLEKLRKSKSRDLRAQPVDQDYLYPTSRLPPNLVAKLPSKVLRNIFARVCPHVLDASYNSAEECIIEDSDCALCDLKSIAQCSYVCRKWSAVVQELLYPNIRIEPVHYCEREYELAKQRKRTGRFEKNGDPIDAPTESLKLLMRTVREKPRLAQKVNTLRLPYMTREANKAELARIVAVLPNLRYMDLPEGFYSDDLQSHALKRELQASCPQIRRMKFNAGSEKSFCAMPKHRIWPYLEILEIHGLRVDPVDMLYVIGSLRNLQDLKFVEMPYLDDNIFTSSSSSIPLFPAVTSITFQDTPNITAKGFAGHLSQTKAAHNLRHLSLSSTGIKPHHIHHILSRARNMETLNCIENVDMPFPTERKIPLLSSYTLRELHFEITEQRSNPKSPRVNSNCVTTKYYGYLIESLITQPPPLPALTHLYVRDEDFPNTLLLSSSLPRPFAPPARESQAYSLAQPLNIFTKGANELEWNFASVLEPSEHLPPSQIGHRRGSSTGGGRPISMMGAESLSSNWAAGGSRKSVVVSNGVGGFLAVPDASTMPRPGSRGSVTSSHTGGHAHGGSMPFKPGHTRDRSKSERRDLFS